MKLPGFLVIGGLFGLPCALLAQSVPVPKTNPIPVYVQFMPWFQTPETMGANNWGWHWTMNNQNPNTIIKSNGERQIASYYYPLIGPYDSSDQYVIEYQMLLMKLSGISGAIVDWYGVDGTNGDEASLLNASNKIVSATQNYGLQVGVTLEDRFAGSKSDVTANINYLEQNYYTQSNYIRVGSSNSPLTLLFGPETYQLPCEWTNILSGVQGQTPAIVPLQYQASQVGSPAVGEFGWVYQDPDTTDNLTVQKNFLANEAPKFSTSIGVAYAGYNDFYAAGDDPSAAAGFVIPESDSNGQTLAETLAQDQTYSKNINSIQIATWNDYGEGTQIEPTVQDGFTDLEEIQKFTGVPYGLSQLQLVYQLYEARAQFEGNTSGEATLSQVASDINQLDFTDAHTSFASALASVPSSISFINALTLSGAAALNVTNQQLVIDYAANSDPVAAIRAYLTTGYNGGAWNGLGIDSSAAAGNSHYALGYADSADPSNPAGLSSNQIEIKYTLYGDTNLDGTVNSIDFGNLAANFGKSGKVWDQGDFDYNGVVNSIDFGLLASNFGESASGADVTLSSSDWAALDAFAAANGLLADVPEPALLPVLAAMFILMQRRRPKQLVHVGDLFRAFTSAAS
ncbi:MAG TPA: hypothetical protein VHX86_17655 [Tepidisphaeraceae bacterium]|nr:hypothetical protein [Tepidisphaeraceae bacterium]